MLIRYVLSRASKPTDTIIVKPIVLPKLMQLSRTTPTVTMYAA